MKQTISNVDESVLHMLLKIFYIRYKMINQLICVLLVKEEYARKQESTSALTIMMYINNDEEMVKLI